MKIIDSTSILKCKFVALAAVIYGGQRGSQKNWDMVSRGEARKCISGEVQRSVSAIIVPDYASEEFC